MVEPAPHGAKRAGPKREGAAAALARGSRLAQGGPSSSLQAGHEGRHFSRNGKKPVSGRLGEADGERGKRSGGSGEAKGFRRSEEAS